MNPKGGSESEKTGAVVLRPITGSVGCRIIDLMRRVTPRGAAKPWRTRENVDLVERVRAAGVPPEELEAYVEGCAGVVQRGEEQAIYWSVRQLFTAPTMDWWRGKVAAAEHAVELAHERDLERRAQAERESIEREARREAAAASRQPVDLELRRASADLRASVLNRARAQELAAATVARLSGAAPGGCPKCSAVVAAAEKRCPACGAALVDANGQRRRGMAHA